MFVIEPLYAGDISVDSIYENGEISHLVYELDELWNGDQLVAGTDVFAVGGELLDILRADNFKGYTLRNMDMLYEGRAALPDFMQLIPQETLNLKHGEYAVQADNDVYLASNVGEIAVSDRLYEIIKKYMNADTFKSHEIFLKETKGKPSGKFEYEYIIITANSTPFELLPYEMRKRSKMKNGEYKVSAENGEVYISAPYIECLKNFDIDVHEYMNIWDPYFLVVKGNEKASVIEAVKSMSLQKCYIARSFSERFVPCSEFIAKNDIGGEHR